VGLSGGKDSMILMHILTALQKNAPINFSLEVVTFDPGFEEFEIDQIKSFCQKQNWSHHVVGAPVAKILKEKNAEDRPCALCSRLRRGFLYKKAIELKCNKVALGHNLDDIVVSFLMSLFRGGGLTTMGPSVPANDNSLQVIRPLSYVTEEQVLNLAAEMDLPVFGKCKYEVELDQTGDRAYFMKFLKSIEKRNPNIRQHVLHSLQEVRVDYLLDKKFLKL
jgi:tRNA 2-thiocytidine biosynthesis protein TtcA